jgi:periplasmic mercuric ion binding protein
MKNLKLIITALVIILTVSAANAQKKKTETIVINTSSVVCDMCKETIETALAYEKGVKSSNLDVKKKTITVKYNPEKTTPEQIRKAISESGYDADDVKANPEAFTKLEECCKDASKCDEIKKK